MATENLRYNIILNDQVSAGLAKIEARLARLESGFDRSNKSADSMNGFMKGSFMLGAAGAIANIANQFGSLAIETLNTAGSLQASTNAIRVASGSSAEFEKNMAFLNDLTMRMPINLEAAIDGYKTWSGAIMETSLAGDTGRKIFEQVSMATAAMGVSAEDTKGIFLAMGQMVSKGTVQAEELKGQLGERLPGAFLLAAKSMNVTTMELNDLLKQGKVTADVLLPHLGDQLEGRFKAALENANLSINASTTRLENMRTRGIIAMTPAISQFMFQFANAMEKTSSWLTMVWEKSEPIKDAFGSLFETFGNTASALYDTFNALFAVFGAANGGIPIMKILGTVIMNMLVPLHIFNASLQLTYRLFETLYLVIAKIIEGDFTSIGDLLSQQAGKIEDVFLNTFDNIAKGYTDIWTDEKKVTAEGEIAPKEGQPMKGLLGETLGAPTLDQGKTKELEKASANISGSAPRNVTISINSLIGQNNNYISNVSDPQKDLATFIDKLKQALQQEIIDVNIQML